MNTKIQKRKPDQSSKDELKKLLNEKNLELKGLKRELQIEAALERVRARSMAMHSTEELANVSSVVYEELNKLGITTFQSCGFHIIDEQNEIQQVWNFHIDLKQLTRFHMPMKGNPILEARYAAWKQRENVFYQKVGGQQLNDLLEFISDQDLALGSASSWIEKYDFPDPVHFHFANFSRGYLHVNAAEAMSEEHKTVLGRFARVFEQTYTRFLDLQKAEAQAREAQIEAALEKVRSRTMGMQRSDELQDAAMILFQQVEALGIPIFGCGFNIWDDDRKAATAWMAGKDRLQPPFKTSSSEDIFLPIQEAEQRGESLFVEEQGGEALKTHYAYMNSIPVFKEITDKMAKAGQSFPTFQIMHCAYFSQGYLMFISYEPVSYAYDIFKRLARVFEQTYTRFLDLQKAEEQAREAQIEAALEKVRSRTMAMQKSEDLVVTAELMFQQLQELGGNLWGCGFVLLDPDNPEGEFWMNAEGEFQPPIYIPNTKDPATINMYNGWKEGAELYSEEAGGDALKEHYNYLLSLPKAGPAFRGMLEAGLSFPTWQQWHAAYFSHGYLLIITKEPFKQVDLFKRFAKVFQQTYTRFLDLKQVEAREKEAIKQSSLDRVRGEIASMRTTSDLQRITPLIWNELIILGVPFFRCGVFIIEENEQRIHAYLSTPQGKSLGVLKLSFDSSETNQNVVDHWRQQKPYSDYWDKKQFKAWTKSMIEQGQIKAEKQFQDGEVPPVSLSLQFIPFTQGMLYVGSSEPLSNNHIDLVKSLAETFSVAYARYEDFKKLEEAKGRVENTLTELKAAQNQLIQAEKMASLGELTAGIAHEIQNPLNFVNNFSEVSKELAVELKEEVLKPEMDRGLISDIAEDITQNQEKIHHHGRRASEIVKGMLQHSRGSSNKKELTDINVLADEYLRLAYHGFRAKDKSFNATFKTDLDETLPKINVIPQDIGRVLLNLINNAFYAVSEALSDRQTGSAKETAVSEKRRKTEGGDYVPLVKVSTRLINGNVEIQVSDNGNGIPEHILDKIFQPFFTTKPTGQGTGLGLSLSYDIVKAHGGEMKVESKEDVGSEFIMNIPFNS